MDEVFTLSPENMQIRSVLCHFSMYMYYIIKFWYFTNFRTVSWQVTIDTWSEAVPHPQGVLTSSVPEVQRPLGVESASVAPCPVQRSPWPKTKHSANWWRCSCGKFWAELQSVKPGVFSIKVVCWMRREMIAADQVDLWWSFSRSLGLFAQYLWSAFCRPMKAFKWNNQEGTL